MLKIRVCPLAELKPGTSVEKRILARRLAVFNDGGELLAIEADCKHMKASLAAGNVKDGIVTCRWHGWQYDLRSGQCLTVEGMKLKRYEIEIAAGDVFVLID